jgi:hypothetical protein
MGHHGEGDVAIPTVPVAHLIVVEPGLAFGLLDTLFHGVSSGGHLGQGEQREVGGGIGQVVGEVAEGTAGQQPALPTRQLVDRHYHRLCMLFN